MSESANTEVWIRRTRIGVSIAICAVIAGSEYAALKQFTIVQKHGAIICIAFVVTGVIAWIIGWYNRHENIGSGATHPLSILGQSRFWGLILILSSALNYFALAYRQPAPFSSPIIAKAKQPLAFPTMKLNGLVFREHNSSAIINSQTYHIGDLIGHARITAIDRESVTVELAGTKQVVSLSR